MESERWEARSPRRRASGLAWPGPVLWPFVGLAASASESSASLRPSLARSLARSLRVVRVAARDASSGSIPNHHTASLGLSAAPATPPSLGSDWAWPWLEWDGGEWQEGAEGAIRGALASILMSMVATATSSLRGREETGRETRGGGASGRNRVRP